MAQGGIILTTNLPDFTAQMRAFRQELRDKIVSSALSAASEVYKKAVIQNAPILKKPDRRKNDPRQAGTLRRAIYKYRRRNTDNGKLVYSISWRKGKKQQARKGGSRDAFYGRFLELGWIPRGPGRRFKGGERSRKLGRERAMASGARRISHPFLVPGFNAATQAALAAFNRRMQLRIDQANKANK